MLARHFSTGRRIFAWLVIACVTGTALPAAGLAQDPPAPTSDQPESGQPASVPSGDTATTNLPDRVTVGVHISPPFVMKDGDGYTGMAFDLWEEITDGLNVETEYVVVPTVKELVDKTASGEIDAAVTNLTINKRRAERIDFTQPWFDGGLRIMIDESHGAGFWAMVRGLNDAGYLRAYAWIAFVIVIATLLLTLFDRRFDKDFPPRWREGIADSFYTVMSVATTGRMSRKNLFGWVGRIWSALWLVCGVAVLAYVTSTVTSVMTTIALTSHISNAADLPGKTIGVLSGATAEEYAEENGLAFRTFNDFDRAVSAMMRGRVDAIVGDAPNLEYYAFSNPDRPVSVVGPIFQPEKYGFGIARSSNLARPVTLEILGAYEVEQIEALRAKYFGERP